ncbi:hypothetical protein KW783_02935 [Candidatus Parcubacteria bacterium]|nr:hypothetical protein [Candidatus Parcubacteria bacterium]
MTVDKFKKIIWNHYKKYGRKLPWRETIDPYKILVSEIMLQQTQVSRVIPKYREFLKAFPNFHALSRAPLSKVLIVWRGLGYNRRAIHLKQIADHVTGDYDGKLPNDSETLQSFKGIGMEYADSFY